MRRYKWILESFYTESCLSRTSAALNFVDVSVTGIRYLIDQRQRKTFLAQVKRQRAWAAICSWFIAACIHPLPLLWMVTWLLTNQARASVFWKIKLCPKLASDINFNEDKTGMAQPGTMPYPDADAVFCWRCNVEEGNLGSWHLPGCSLDAHKMNISDRL